MSKGALRPVHTAAYLLIMIALSLGMLTSLYFWADNSQREAQGMPRYPDNVFIAIISIAAVLSMALKLTADKLEPSAGDSPEDTSNP